MLRPLRAITKIEGMRIIVSMLVKALPMLADVGLLLAFLYFIFGAERV